MNYTLYILRNSKVELVDIKDMTDDELLKEYWATKDSKPICENAVKTAPSDRSKATANRNLNNNVRNFNAIKQELINRGVKSITRKGLIK